MTTNEEEIGSWRARLRRARRLAALIGTILICVPPHLLFRLFRLRSPLPKLFLALAARACGVRVLVKGRPVGHGVFYLANHVSWIDILALGGASGAAFVSRDDIAGWPIAGWLARQNNTIFIARRRGALTEQVDALREAMGRHQPVALFPEGTTGNGRALLPFKPALLSVLTPPPRDILIQPVAIDYGLAAPEIAWTDDEGAGANALRLLARKGPLPVTLHFLEPFDPGAHPDRKAVAATARVRIAANLPDLIDNSIIDHGAPLPTGL